MVKKFYKLSEIFSIRISFQEEISEVRYVEKYRDWWRFLGLIPIFKHTIPSGFYNHFDRRIDIEEYLEINDDVMLDKETNKLYYKPNILFEFKHSKYWSKVFFDSYEEIDAYMQGLAKLFEFQEEFDFVKLKDKDFIIDYGKENENIE